MIHKYLLVNCKPDLFRGTLRGKDVNKIITVCDPVACRTTVRTTYLNLVVEQNRRELVEILIEEFGCDVDAPDEDGQTALMHACRRGHLHLVHRLLGAGSNINHKDNKGCTPLFHAAGHGNTDVVRALLIAKGINPDEVNQNEESRAELNQPDKAGYTLLVHALGDHISRDVIQMLLNAGCDVDQKAGDVQETPLDVSIYFDPTGEIPRLLIDHGADVNAADIKGKTSLMNAADEKNAKLVRMLLEKGSDVNKKDQYMRTAFHYACNSYGANIDITRMLIEENIDVNSRDMNNQTIFMHALRLGYTDIIRLLLELHPDFHAVDNDGNTVLIHAVSGCIYADTLRLLLDGGCIDTINMKNNKGQSALHLIVQKSGTEAVGVLLDAGADIKAIDNDDWTVLMHSAKNRDASTVRLLLNNGCADTINNKNKDGESALDVAMHNPKVDVVRVLLGVKDISIDIQRCDQAFAAHYDFDSDLDESKMDAAIRCLKEIAAFVIQRQWRAYLKRVHAAIVIQRQWHECYWNPKYPVCRKRLMEELGEMERELMEKRLKRSE